jgi:hypothetical protein
MRSQFQPRHRDGWARPQPLSTSEPELEVLLDGLITALEAAQATIEELALTLSAKYRQFT